MTKTPQELAAYLRRINAWRRSDIDEPMPDPTELGEAIDQVIAILEKHGLQGSIVELSEVLHLKTGLGYLENNHLLACGEFLDKPEFQKYTLLEVDPDEAYAANSVWVNGTVLTPKGFPKTRRLIETAGYKVREVDVSEFQKLDGGLSCLSLRF